MTIKTDSKLLPQSLAFLNPDAAPPESGDLVLAPVREFYHTLQQEIHKVIVGQEDVIELVLIGLLCQGHVLLEGVPGLGKTLLFRTISKIMDLNFQHVQFTPDLMPADIIGTEIIQTDPLTQERSMRFLKGPVFCHLLLADEINRTSPKTQSALLQAMQDREVSVGNHTYPLEAPFFVVATQNPIDQEGVYPLPEAQLDRFMLNVYVEYPSYQDEVTIAQRYTQHQKIEVETVVSQKEILALQSLVRSMPISETILRFAVDIVTATRPGKDNLFPFVNQWVEWGTGPRATLSLVLAAKARALIKGRYCVMYEDILAVAPSILRHRIKLNFSANAENIKSQDLITKILQAVIEKRGRTESRG